DAAGRAHGELVRKPGIESLPVAVGKHERPSRERLSVAAKHDAVVAAGEIVGSSSDECSNTGCGVEGPAGDRAIVAAGGIEITARHGAVTKACSVRIAATDRGDGAAGGVAFPAADRAGLSGHRVAVTTAVGCPLTGNYVRPGIVARPLEIPDHVHRYMRAATSHL